MWLGQGHSRLGKWWRWLEIGMHSWFEGQGAWHGGLMQTGNVPKELILVDFWEVTTCPTCMEKSKHCVGSKCPGKLSSDVSCRPASASWALSKHALTAQAEGPLCLQLQHHYKHSSSSDKKRIDQISYLIPPAQLNLCGNSCLITALSSSHHVISFSFSLPSAGSCFR